MAQNTWTPPTQPAVGGNTPSPINVSQFAQTKQGKLTVDGGFVSNTGSNLNGPTVLDVSPSQPNNSGYNLVFNFLKSYFLNNLQVGSEGSVGPEVKIVGQLKYKPTDSSGDIPDDSFIPQPGQVLKATDTEGTIAWGTAIPDGVNPGDTLIWSETCNCWTTGPGGGSGNLPNGTDWWQTLTWNNGTSQWIPNNLLSLDTSTAQVYTSPSTNKINLFTDPGVGGTINTKSDGLNIETNTLQVQLGSCVWPCDPTGKLLQATNSAGNISWIDPADIFGEGDSLPQAEAGQTLWYNGDTGEWEATSNLNYTPEDTANIDATNLNIRGSGTEPGQGRIPYSLDAEGKFKWNKNFVYNQQDIPGVGFVNELRLKNEQVGQGQTAVPSILTNEGLTLLQDDVFVDGGNLVVADDGDVYIEGLGSASLLEISQGRVKQLCYVETTGKVVNCDTSIPGQDPSDNEVSPVFSNDYEFIRTFEDNGEDYIFQNPQTVTIEWCGGGGGGGGGGLPLPYRGGGGGGGGAAGECESQEVQVNAGDRLTWNIGDGGIGGRRGEQSEDVNNNVVNNSPGDGGAGGETSVYLQQGIASAVQLGSTVTGGAGGKRGVGSNSLNQYAVPFGTGGPGGDGGATIREPDNPSSPTTLPNIISSPGIWHDGQAGFGTTPTAGVRGGIGGDGESPAGSINYCSTCSGAGGPGGTEGALELGGPLGQYIVGPGNHTNRWGGSGKDGGLSFGGGGGGGGYGAEGPVFYDSDISGESQFLNNLGYAVQLTSVGSLLPIVFSSPTLAITAFGVLNDDPLIIYTNFPGDSYNPSDLSATKSSAGGKGGSGYVKVTNLIGNEGTTGLDYNETNSPLNEFVSLDVQYGIPVQVTSVNIEVWGAGGGGGGVETGALADRMGGGGGAGGYIKLENVPRSVLCSTAGTPCTGTLLINVGDRGSAGDTSINGNNVTNGGNGSNSFIKKSDGTILVTANGGLGGNKDISSNFDDNYGTGGGGGSFSFHNSVASYVTTSSGGFAGGVPAGGQNNTGGNINKGGQGADTGPTGAIGGVWGGQYTTEGQAGRVKISWIP